MVEHNTPNDDDSQNEQVWENTGRDRGILTKTDREYLLGERDIDGQDERNARYRIRQRLTEGFLDITLIALKMSHEDISQVVNNDRLSHEYNPMSLLTLASFFAKHRGATNPTGKMELWLELALEYRPPDKPEGIDDGTVPLAEPKATASVDLDWDRLEPQDYLNDEIASAALGKDISEIESEGLTNQEKEYLAEVVEDAIKENLDQ
jgi:hypothetical protein